jgi:hypothetical protein
MRFQEISRPYTDRGEEPAKERLADEFKRMCAAASERLATPLSSSEVQLLVTKYVPRSVDQMKRRHQHQQKGTEQ